MLAKFGLTTLNIEASRTLMEVPDWSFVSWPWFHFVSLPYRNVLAEVHLPTLSLKASRILMSSMS